MKYTALLLTLLASSAFAADEVNTLTESEKAAGWKLLFDGRTTDSWVSIGKTSFPTQGWTVEDGALHLTKSGGNIVTSESFENFEFSWEWKIASGGNSGIKYNLPDPTRDLGFEYQLLDDVNHPDAKIGGVLHQTAGLYDLIEPASGKKLNPPGQWNQSRIVVDGTHVEHWLNGVKTVEFELGSDAMKAAIAKSKYKNVPKFGEKTKSPILIQDHGDEIWVRSIKVRVL